MIDGCGSRPTLKTSHVTFDRRETGKIYTSFPSAREALVSHLVWILLVFAHVVNPGMSLTMELVVTQLQQEIITLNAQVADRTGRVEAIRAINNLATAHVRKGTLSLVDVKGLGRPKEFTCKEKDFQQCSMKTGCILCWRDQEVRDDAGVVS